MCAVKNGFTSSGAQRYSCKKCNPKPMPQPEPKKKRKRNRSIGRLAPEMETYKSSGQIIKEWLESQGISAKDFLKIR